MAIAAGEVAGTIDAIELAAEVLARMVGEAEAALLRGTSQRSA